MPGEESRTRAIFQHLISHKERFKYTRVFGIDIGNRSTKLAYFGEYDDVRTINQDYRSVVDNYVYITDADVDTNGDAYNVKIDVQYETKSNGRPYNVKRFICMPPQPEKEFPEYIKYKEGKTVENENIFVKYHNKMMCVKVPKGELKNHKKDIFIHVDMIFKESLRHILRVMNRTLDNDSFPPLNKKDIVVITYPANFAKHESRLAIFRNIVNEVFKDKVGKIMLQQESNAAAYFGMAQMPFKDGIAIVVDVGSHTTQVAAVSKQGDVLKDIVSHVDYVGGVDFDANFQTLVQKKMPETITVVANGGRSNVSKQEIINDASFVLSVRRLSEYIKTFVTNSMKGQSASLLYDAECTVREFMFKEITFELPISLPILQILKWTKTVKKKILTIVENGMKEIIESRGYDEQQSIYILITGGASKWPKVEKKLKTMDTKFPNCKKLEFKDRYCVSHGAVLYGFEELIKSEEIPETDVPDSDVESNYIVRPRKIVHKLEFSCGVFAQTNAKAVVPNCFVPKGLEFPMSDYIWADSTYFFRYDTHEPVLNFCTVSEDKNSGTALIAFVKVERGAGQLWPDEHDEFFSKTQLLDRKYLPYDKKKKLGYTYDHVDMCKHMRIGIKFAGQDPTQNISIKLQTPIKEWEIHDLVINPTPEIEGRVYRSYEDLEEMYEKASARVKLSTKFNGHTKKFDKMQILNTPHGERMDTVREAIIEDMSKKKTERYPLMSKKKQDRTREFNDYKSNVLKSDDENEEKKAFVRPKKSSKRKSAPERLSFDNTKFPDQMPYDSSQEVPSSESVATRSAKVSKKSTNRKSNSADEQNMKTSSKRRREKAPEISEESSEESLEEFDDSDYIESDQEKKSKRRKSNEPTKHAEEKRVTRSRSK